MGASKKADWREEEGTKYTGRLRFYEIAKGARPAIMVFADEHVLTLMGPEQPNSYSVLIIPRGHLATLYDLTHEQAAQIFQTKAVSCLTGIIRLVNVLNWIFSLQIFACRFSHLRIK